MMVGGIDKQIYLPYQLAQRLGLLQEVRRQHAAVHRENGGVGAEDAMASGQVDMAGAWYIHTIDFPAKGKNVIDVVQLSGAPGEREMCGTNSGVHSAADFKGKSLGVTDLGSGTDELTQFLASKQGIAPQRVPHRCRRGRSDRDRGDPGQQVQCVMTTQPTVGALESKQLAYPAIDLATTAGAKQALGGAWPAAGVLAKADWVKSHQSEIQDVVDALVATMHWISTHSAADIADKCRPVRLEQHDQQGAVHRRSATDKGQFLPDGVMPAGGPKTIYAMEKMLGVDVGKVDLEQHLHEQLRDEGEQARGLQGDDDPGHRDRLSVAVHHLSVPS